jgi:hypothetical protein
VTEAEPAHRSFVDADVSSLRSGPAFRPRLRLLNSERETRR